MAAPFQCSAWLKISFKLALQNDRDNTVRSELPLWTRTCPYAVQTIEISVWSKTLLFILLFSLQFYTEMNSHEDRNNKTTSVESKHYPTYHIWQHLALNEMLPKVDNSGPRVNAKMALWQACLHSWSHRLHHPIGFSCVVERYIRKISRPRFFERTARYSSAYLIESYHKTWINIIHYFLVVYKNCKRRRSSSGHNCSGKALICNVKGMNLTETNDKDEKDAEEITSITIQSTRRRIISKKRLSTWLYLIFFLI